MKAWWFDTLSLGGCAWAVTGAGSELESSLPFDLLGSTSSRLHVSFHGFRRPPWNWHPQSGSIFKTRIQDNNYYSGLKRHLAFHDHLDVPLSWIWINDLATVWHIFLLKGLLGVGFLRLLWTKKGINSLQPATSRYKTLQSSAWPSVASASEEDWYLLPFCSISNPG